MKVSKIIFFVLFLLFIGQILYFYPKLPQTVPIHFGVSGVADRFSDKSEWLTTMLILFGVLTILTLFLPLFLEKVNDTFLNLPNKSYWLAPERRSETFATIKIFFDWFGSALLVLANTIVWASAVASFSQNPSLPNIFFFVFIGFVIFMLFWTYKFYTKFNKIDL